MILISYLSNYLETNYVGEYQNYVFKTKVDVINLGTSHGSTSFNWELFDNFDGVNLARSGQPISYDLQLLTHYSEYIDKDTLIIILLSLHTFCMDQDNFSDLDAIYGGGFPLFGFVRTSKIYYMLESIIIGRSFPEDKYGGLIEPGFGNDSFWNCTNSETDEVVDNILKISNQFHNVIFVTTPRYTPTNHNRDYYNVFYMNVNKTLELTKREYYDFSFDERFDNIEYFYNSHHLNSLGRERFTQIIIEDIMKKDE